MSQLLEEFVAYLQIQDRRPAATGRGKGRKGQRDTDGGQRPAG